MHRKSNSQLKKLTVLGSVLYIGAHPDDENTALLATLAQDRCYRTAYLSITRGEGGQNLLGPEQGEMLGLIRTQELLAARRIDGAEQYFTSAIDFGFSKTSEETLRFWGKEKTLADVVWIIRKFRPDVIVTRFTPIIGRTWKSHSFCNTRRRSISCCGRSFSFSGTVTICLAMASKTDCVEWIPPVADRYNSETPCLL